jgi:hypothetical protein
VGPIPRDLQERPSTTTKKTAWETFRIGPFGSYQTEAARRTAFPGTQFPTGAFDQFAKQFVPAWATNAVAAQAAYDELVQRVCPCVVMAHSQGGLFAFRAAARAPEKIKALIAVEPAGAPPPDNVTSSQKDVSHLVVWGDYFDGYDRWNDIKRDVEKYESALRSLGGTADRLDLPALGIAGNSHMLMMDRNSDRIAALIQAWMDKKRLMR